MKATINVSANYFSHDWTLVVDFQDGLIKEFYLGQDVKFCHRVLGYEASYVVEQIGSNDLSKESVRKKLAKFIIKDLGLNARSLRTLERWSLACQ